MEGAPRRGGRRQAREAREPHGRAQPHLGAHPPLLMPFAHRQFLDRVTRPLWSITSAMKASLLRFCQMNRCSQAECVQHGLRTIAFCKTRKMCELVTAYTRETLKDTAPHLANTISVYRAGYSPEVRAFTLPCLLYQAPKSLHEVLM